MEEDALIHSLKPYSRRTGILYLRLFWLATAIVAVLTWWPVASRIQAQRVAADHSHLIYVARQFAATDCQDEPDVQRYVMRVDSSDAVILTHQAAKAAEVKISLPDTHQVIRVTLARDRDGYWQGQYALKSGKPAAKTALRL